MVKLTEVEDEHFAQEKPQTSKNNVLLDSDDEEDYTDTESEISNDEEIDLESEGLYERLSALKDIIPPSARRSVNNTVSSVTSFTKSTISFSGKALWIISTSAFLLGVPWALAYAEEEQYIQMEREQGMIKGANEVCSQTKCYFALSLLALLGCSGIFGGGHRRAPDDGDDVKKLFRQQNRAKKPENATFSPVNAMLTPGAPTEEKPAQPTL
ncbi:hypothetical protein N8T08_005895 [Aspergillus melleus]|uniref:Uncharacterized protein n=1 Tax=Aspergillus melleus TaxID=138277 RepID=A0ACC3B0Y2_9EURO|nr:hypothetical protein N8T08_005895 [Aspergillus melleus]